MPRARRSIQSTMTIDGFTLIWRLHREQQSCGGDEWKGIAIHVKAAEGAHRELYLEYPAVKTQKRGFTRTDEVRPAILALKVEAHIRQAMAEGWDPDSRGKPFVFQVTELPN